MNQNTKQTKQRPQERDTYLYPVQAVEYIEQKYPQVVRIDAAHDESGTVHLRLILDNGKVLPHKSGIFGVFSQHRLDNLPFGLARAMETDQ